MLDDLREKSEKGFAGRIGRGVERGIERAIRIRIQMRSPKRIRKKNPRSRREDFAAVRHTGLQHRTVDCQVVRCVRQEEKRFKIYYKLTMLSSFLKIL